MAKVVSNHKKTAVFVYGTLRDGEANNHVMHRLNCKKVGTADLSGYRLYIHKSNGLPFIAKCTGTEVFGEIWLADENAMRVLDRIEGYHGNHGTMAQLNHYNRRTVKVARHDTSEKVDVQVYVGGANYLASIAAGEAHAAGEYGDYAKLAAELDAIEADFDDEYDDDFEAELDDEPETYHGGYSEIAAESQGLARGCKILDRFGK